MFRSGPERRDYNRIKVDIPCTIYTKTGEEILGNVIDICENGIRLCIDNIQQEDFVFAKGQFYKLSFIDDITMGKYEDNFIIVCEIIIVRTKNHKNYLELGCRVRPGDYTDYVLRKKFSLYYQKGENQ